MSPRRAAELTGLAIAIATWSYLAWDSALWDPRFQLALHLAGASAVAGLVVLALRGGELPRTRLNLPIVVLLLAFGVASLSAWNAGLSARAMVGIVGTTAMLPVALLALRHRPGWTALVVTLPIIVLSAGALAVLAWRRIEWVLVGAPGLPPVRLAHEGTPFGSVAVPPFIILAALPLALLIPSARVRRAVLVALAGVGVPLTLLSGSRSAWIAIGITLVALAGPWLARGIRRLRGLRLRGRPTPRVVAGVLAAAALAVLAIAFVAPRLTDVSSLVYREYLWRDTLRAWSGDPWLGIGPGSMPWARQAAAPDFTFPEQQPHSHNVLLGIAGDAGLVGVAAGLGLVAAFVLVAGPWHQRSLPGRAAFAVLAGLAGGMMFEDLTFLPGFNLEVLLLVAIALSGAGAVHWRPVHVRPVHVRPAAGIAVAVAGSAALVAVMVVGDAAWIAYRTGIDAAEQGHWRAATTWLQRSEALDPWQPSTPKSLAVAADRLGDNELALAAARRAVDLNPGDGLSWTNLAVLCRARDDAGCARHAAGRAAATAGTTGPELANAALIEAWLGDAAAADEAYRRSLLTNWPTAITVPWPRHITLDGDRLPELGESTVELNSVVARAAFGDPIDPHAVSSLPARLLAQAVLGNRDAALATAAELEGSGDATATYWLLVALIRGHYGLPVDHELDVAAVANGRPVAIEPGPAARSTTDIAAFRAYPADGLVVGAARLQPNAPWPWALEPLLPPG